MYVITVFRWSHYVFLYYSVKHNLLLATEGQICYGCHRWSIVCCSSGGHILKTTQDRTTQDRPIVTMDHCQEVGVADSVAAFGSSPDSAVGKCLGFRYKICTNINAASCWHQTTTVVNRARPSSCTLRSTLTVSKMASDNNNCQHRHTLCSLEPIIQHNN